MSDKLPHPPYLKRWLLTLFRLSLLLAIAWMIRTHHERQRVLGDKPIQLSEVREWLPNAAYLKVDNKNFGSLKVLDQNGKPLGTALRTSPYSNKVIGYTGPTDTLIVFDNQGLKGLKIRHSFDTPTHVEDVSYDYLFMERWNGMNIQTIAKMDLKEAGVEGVSGATRTSMCIARSLIHRLKKDSSNSTQHWRYTTTDFLLMLVLIGAILLYFTRQFKYKKVIRTLYRLAAFTYIGFVSGDILSWSLLKGWIEFDLPFQHLPGLTLLAVASLLIPATTGKPIYCGQICPHGLLQEYLSRFTPKAWHKPLSPSLIWSLKWIPPLLICVIILTSLFLTSLDVASLEAFDAYLLGAAALASIFIALFSLILSTFIPMGYCKYGCPTGALLSFARSHGSADKLGKRDFVAILICLMVFIITFHYDAIQHIIMNSSWI